MQKWLLGFFLIRRTYWARYCVRSLLLPENRRHWGRLHYTDDAR